MPEKPRLYSNRRSVYKILPERSFQGIIGNDCDLNFRWTGSGCEGFLPFAIGRASKDETHGFQFNAAGAISVGNQSAVKYRDYQRQRSLTLGDLLLENRIILLQGEIHDGNASEVVMKLLYLQSENRRKEINFYINSPGGSVTGTMAIYDTMQILSCPVATYCVGLAASGGAGATGRAERKANASLWRTPR